MPKPEHSNVLIFELGRHGLLKKHKGVLPLPNLFDQVFIFEYEDEHYRGAIAGKILSCELYYTTVSGTDVRGIRIAISVRSVADVFGQEHPIDSIVFLKGQPPLLRVLHGHPVKGNFKFASPIV